MDNFDLKKFLVENKLTQLSEGLTPQQFIDMIRDTKFNDLSKMPNDEKLAGEVVKLLNKPENKDAKEKLEKLTKIIREGMLKNTLLTGILALTGLATNPVKAQSYEQDPTTISTTDSTINTLLSYSSQDLVDLLKNDEFSLYENWFENFKYYYKYNKNDINYKTNVAKLTNIYNGIEAVIGHGDAYLGRDFNHVVQTAIEVFGKYDIDYDLAKANFKHWAETSTSRIYPVGSEVPSTEDPSLSNEEKRNYETFKKMSKEDFDLVLKMVKIHQKLGID